VSTQYENDLGDGDGDGGKTDYQQHQLHALDVPPLAFLSGKASTPKRKHLSSHVQRT
jgi:hypothetical protein